MKSKFVFCFLSLFIFRFCFSLSMDKHLFQFEDLPNEILIVIFKNLDVQDLFQAFYNLNTRFNMILESVNHCLTIDTSDFHQFDDNKIFFPYIDTLIIQKGADNTFIDFLNVRRVILYYTSDYSVMDLQVNIAPSVEYISVRSVHPWLFTFMTYFIDKIFSNGFPYLKSCCLPSTTFLLTTERWTQSPALRIFTTGFIGSNIYEAILTSCPNLYSLQFNKLPMDKSTVHMKPHTNLKCMKINLFTEDCLNQDSLNSYFLSVPKLERLTIKLTLRESHELKSMEDFDWFTSIIDCCLPMLHQFDCHIIFDPSARIDEIEVVDILDQYKEKFKQIHNDRYQSKIVFKFPDD